MADERTPLLKSADHENGKLPVKVDFAPSEKYASARLHIILFLRAKLIKVTST